ncbi:dihydroorotase [Planctomycetes bacterium Poly30]|uniref:Dihydroorotase n=1 Tax=Saltatorellus ferox TaxID=2528018 RepID=A0A518EXG3_9BACT|nr:dihydroorotase [Planctomycetes bacterium Poly30]
MIPSLTLLLSASLLGLHTEGPDTLVLRNVQVACPTASEIQPERRVTVEFGAIVRIDAEGKSPVPVGARVIDGGGRYLAPGFYDMHTHLPGVDSPIPASFRRDALRMMLESGITTARVGRGAHELLADKRAIARGEIPGPRLFVAAPPLARNRFLAIEEAPLQFALWKAQGFDAVKFLSGPPAGELSGYARAAEGAGLRWYGHKPMGPLTDWPLESMASLEHASALERMAAVSPDTLERDLARLAEHRIFVCPDIDWYFANSEMEALDVLLARDGIDLLPAEVVKEWTEQRRLPNPRRATYQKTVEVFRELAPALRKAGVELLVSPSDAPFYVPGKSYVIEAQHLADAGYSPLEVLRMATLNGARCQGEASLRGSVQPGRVADLVLLKANPFEDVSALGQVSCVIVGGDVVVGE